MVFVDWESSSEGWVDEMWEIRSEKWTVRSVLQWVVSSKKWEASSENRPIRIKDLKELEVNYKNWAVKNQEWEVWPSKKWEMQSVELWEVSRSYYWKVKHEDVREWQRVEPIPKILILRVFTWNS